MVVALSIFWILHIFNIAYTGILGWNMHPATKLEENLDTITMAGMITSWIMLFHGVLKTK